MLFRSGRRASAPADQGIAPVASDNPRRSCSRRPASKRFLALVTGDSKIRRPFNLRVKGTRPRECLTVLGILLLCPSEQSGAQQTPSGPTNVPRHPEQRGAGAALGPAAARCQTGSWLLASSTEIARSQHGEQLGPGHRTATQGHQRRRWPMWPVFDTIFESMV